MRWGGGVGGAGNCLSMKSAGDLVAQLMLARRLLLSEDACMTLVMSCGYNVAETSCNIWPQTYLLMFLGRSMRGRGGMEAGNAGRVVFRRKHVRVGGAGNCLSMKSAGDLVAQLMLARWLLLSEDACMTLVMSCGYNVAKISAMRRVSCAAIAGLLVAPWFFFIPQRP